jgi:hypothetical protein
MDTIDEVVTRLRDLGYQVGAAYVQAGVAPTDGRMYIPVSGVAMTFPQAMELARGRLTLNQIRAQNEHLANMILFDKADADRVAIVQNPSCPDARLCGTVDAPMLIAAVERLNSHSVYEADHIARLLSDCGVPVLVTDDSTVVLIGKYRLEPVKPEWGQPGISALTVLGFAYRLILQAEPRSEMIGRGFWFRDVLDKLKAGVARDAPGEA